MEMQPQLEPNDLRSRLGFDYQVVMLMRSPMMMVEAYRNLDDLEARRSNAMVPGTEGHLATHYRVDYHIKTLIGRGLYSNMTTVRFDLFANNNYPFSEPGCFVIDSKTPWSPHFLEGHHICIGPIWEQSAGSMLLGELMVHIAKLLNFDEPEYAEANYVGWNSEAIEYWKSALGRQPITKNLVYPPLPDLVHAVPAPEPEPTKSFVRKKVIGSSAPAITIRRAGQAKTGPARIRIRIPGGSQ